jgi:hypothetical protein
MIDRLVACSNIERSEKCNFATYHVDSHSLQEHSRDEWENIIDSPSRNRDILLIK